MQLGSSETLTTKAEDIFYYRQMRNRIVAALLVVSFFPLLLIGAATYHYAASALQRRTLDYLKEKLLSHKKVIDQFLSERLMDVRLLADTSPIDRLLLPGALEEAFRALEASTASYVDLGVISEEGKHLAYVGPYDLLSKKYRGTAWFAEVMERGAYISDVFLGFRGVPHFVVAVTKVAHGKTYILRATIDAQHFDRIVSEVVDASVKKGDAFVVNREGVFQSSPRRGGRCMGQSEYKEIAHFEGVQVTEGPVELCAMVWLEQVPWLCVVKLDKKEVFSPLWRLRLTTMVVFVLGGVLIVCTVLMTTKYLVARLEIKRRDILQLDTRLLQTSSMASSVPLVAGLIKELNEHLSSIDTAAGWIQDLLQGEIVDKSHGIQEIRDSASRIRTEVKRGRRVTDRIVTLTRPTVPIIKEVQVNEVLDDVVALLERDIKERGIKILREYDDHLPLIRSDPAQLRQAFQHILVYSVASLGEQGSGRITLSTTRSYGGVTAKVSDNGPGIPREELERLFDTYTDALAGPMLSGRLALSLTTGILERLGGRLAIQSEPGSGTSFIVELPFHARPASTDRGTQ